MSSDARAVHEMQFEMYRDFLDYFTDHCNFKGNNELTIADFGDCDKTANFVVCPIIHIENICLDDLIEHILWNYPTYSECKLCKDEHGRLVLLAYIAWNVVYEEEQPRRQSRQYKPAPHRPTPPPMWQGVTSAFGMVLTALFAFAKEPLLGWP